MDARDSAKGSTTHRTTLTTQSDLVHNVNNAWVGNSATSSLSAFSVFAYNPLALLSLSWGPS